jgi:nucleoside-diphosphate-sugar epimerase
LEINEMSSAQDQNHLVALVTGANGITGAYVAQMAKEPHWKRIITTSRRPPLNLPKDPRIEFAQADLSGDKESIAKSLKDANAIGVTHFFHVRVIQVESKDPAHQED